jgi:hypothetical protein
MIISFLFVDSGILKRPESKHELHTHHFPKKIKLSRSYREQKKEKLIQFIFQLK